MSLTAQQLATWKTDIAANVNTINDPNPGPYQGRAINSLSILNSDEADAIAKWYNHQASPSFFGNYRNVPAADIFNAVSWKAYTPTDAVPTDTALNVAISQARTLFAANFQMNLQTMLIGRDTIDATKSSIVQGFKDATNANMPTGAGGADTKGGWTGIQKILCRLGSYIEKLLADTSGGTGADNTHAATFTFEGTVSYQDLQA